MKKILSLFIIGIIIFQSCKNCTKEYHDSGTLKEEKCLFDNKYFIIKTYYDTTGILKSVGYENMFGLNDSITKEFDSNGKLISSITYVDGDSTGLYTLYYPSGNVKEEIILKNGKRDGPHIYYNDNNDIEEIWFYKLIDNTSYFNGMLKFDKNGNIISNKSKFVGIYLHQDTIEYSDTLFFEFEIRTKQPISGIAYLGKYDNNFKLIDSSSLTRININDVNYIIPQNNRNDTLRVLFDLYNSDEQKMSFLLEKPFFVKKQ